MFCKESKFFVQICHIFNLGGSPLVIILQKLKFYKTQSGHCLFRYTSHGELFKILIQIKYQSMMIMRKIRKTF